MNLESNASNRVKVLSRIIETPAVIVAKTRVSELTSRIMLEGGISKVMEELRAEVSNMSMPRRFSRTRIPYHKHHEAGVLNSSFVGLAEDEHKRQQLLLNLDSVGAEIPEAILKGDIARAIYLLEAVVMDIEATKTESTEDGEDPVIVSLQGHNIVLEKISSVFSPSPHGLFLGENIKINPGESVIDIGTGSGLFAILASKMGGRVCATEITREAVEMTKYNSAFNGVEVDVRQGSFFASFDGKFDVLIANLPQKLILKKREQNKIFDTRPLGVWGGNDGNEILLSFLEEAKKHMHQNSRLYIQVYSLTNYNRTLSRIDRDYVATELARREFIEDDIVSQNIEAYEELRKTGVIDYSSKDGHYVTYETAYELKLRSEKK
jgi:release factor glutamine methyltransferase